MTITLRCRFPVAPIHRPTYPSTHPYLPCPQAHGTDGTEADGGGATDADTEAAGATAGGAHPATSRSALLPSGNGLGGIGGPGGALNALAAADSTLALAALPRGQGMGGGGGSGSPPGARRTAAAAAAAALRHSGSTASLASAGSVHTPRHAKGSGSGERAGLNGAAGAGGGSGDGAGGAKGSGSCGAGAPPADAPPAVAEEPSDSVVGELRGGEPGGGPGGPACEAQDVTQGEERSQRCEGHAGLADCEAEASAQRPALCGVSRSACRGGSGGSRSGGSRSGSGSGAGKLKSRPAVEACWPPAATAIAAGGGTLGAAALDATPCRDGMPAAAGGAGGSGAAHSRRAAAAALADGPAGSARLLTVSDLDHTASNGLPASLRRQSPGEAHAAATGQTNGNTTRGDRERDGSDAGGSRPRHGKGGGSTDRGDPSARACGTTATATEVRDLPARRPRQV